MMLDMLQRRREEDLAKYGSVTLMVDAMAIKKHVQYNPYIQKISRFVDMGDGKDETDVATEVLVFMVVGLQVHWKKSGWLLPHKGSDLSVHAREELHGRGIRVLCMTMDGHASNVSMCKQLGCQLKGNAHKPLRTFFEHPVTAERVFVLMDACHMFKLARNMLQANSPITSTSGAISWSYNVELNSVQNKDGLHAANKITNKHVHFDGQKMKVSLAAQTLSHSVAIALHMLRDIGDSQFKNCDATVEFFDVKQHAVSII